MAFQLLRHPLRVQCTFDVELHGHVGFAAMNTCMMGLCVGYTFTLLECGRLTLFPNIPI